MPARPRANATVERAVEFAGVEIDFRFECRVSPGDPGVNRFRNGDPGYPPEPASAEILDVSCVDSRFDDDDAAALSKALNVLIDHDHCEPLVDEVEEEACDQYGERHQGFDANCA